jgi:hypothetical protein
MGGREIDSLRKSAASSSRSPLERSSSPLPRSRLASRQRESLWALRSWHLLQGDLGRVLALRPPLHQAEGHRQASAPHHGAMLTSRFATSLIATKAERSAPSAGTRWFAACDAKCESQERSRRFLPQISIASAAFSSSLSTTCE